MKTQDIKNMGQAWRMVQEGTKFEIPEEVPAQERTAFHGAAAAAHKAGKSHFTMNGKKYPVTMKKDTAKAISDEVEEAYNEPQGQAKRMMSPLQKIRQDKEKADRDKDGKLKKEEDEVVMNPKKDKKAKADADCDTATTEGVEKMKDWPIYKRIMEKASHTAGAAEAEPVDSKDSPTAKKMRDDAKAKEKEKITDYDDLGHDDASKAGRAGPSRKMRNGDNQASDKMEKPIDTTKG